MSTTSSSYSIAAHLPLQQPLAVRSHLENCHEQSSEWPEAMKQAWSELKPKLYTKSYPAPSDSSNDPAYFRYEIARFKLIGDELTKFRSDFSEYIDASLAEALDGQKNLIVASINALKSSNLFISGDREKNITKKMELYWEGMEHYSQCILGNLNETMRLREKGDMPEKDFIYMVDSMRVSIIGIRDICMKIVQGLPPISSERKKVLLFLQRIEAQIKASLWDIERITLGAEPLGFVVSLGEPYPVVLDTQYAEGKAVQRIHNPVPDDEWELAYKPGDQIDVEDLDAQLRACGYID